MVLKEEEIKKLKKEHDKRVTELLEYNNNLVESIRGWKRKYIDLENEYNIFKEGTLVLMNKGELC